VDCQQQKWTNGRKCDHPSTHPSHNSHNSTLACLQAQTSGDVGRVMMIVITDGRANVNLAKSNEDPAAMEPDAPKPTAEELKVG
jgi:magnesium chelatase subunit D